MRPVTPPSPEAFNWHFLQMPKKSFIWKTLGVMELSVFLHLKKNLFEKSTGIQLRKENLRVVFEFILSA